MSQITVTGSRKRKIRNEIHMAAGLYAIDDLIDDLLNARAHVLDTPRSKRADNETAQPAMIGWIELQHPVAHAAIDRFLKNFVARIAWSFGQ